ncbi:MAG: hypothetical protein JNM17_35685 [Archangium sp.]|nr:hypothetical protein [Archangium sp.]
MKRFVALAFLLIGCATTKGVIWGEVSTATTPFPNAEVALIDSHGTVVRRTTTNALGRFELRDLRDGQYLIAMQSDAGLLAPDTTNTTTVELPPNGIRNATITILPASFGAPVSGQVRDQFDRPVAGMKVCARGGERDTEHCVLSRADGSFVVPWVLAGGPVSISAWPIERTDDTYHWSDTLEVKAGDSNVLLRASYRPSLKLRVVDENGQRISVFHVDDRVYSGPLSTREWPKDRPLEIAAEGYATEFVTLPSMNPEGDVDVPAVVLTRGELVRGKIVDALSGKPIEGALVIRPGSLRRLTEGSHTWCGTCADSWEARQLPESKSDASGRFELRLTPTQRELRVMATDYRTLTIRREGTELVVKLDRGAIIEGRVFDPLGAPVASAMIETMPGKILRRAEDDGTFSLLGLEPGSYLVRALTPQGQLVQQVNAVMGKTTRIELRATTGRSLRVGAGSKKSRLVSLCAGTCALPSDSELERFLAGTVRPDVFTDGQFSGLHSGRYTVFVWRIVRGDVVLESEPVTVNAEGRLQQFAFSGIARRSYPNAARLLENEASD